MKINHTNIYDDDKNKEDSSKHTEDIFINLNKKKTTIDDGVIQKATDSTYNASYIAKTGRKGISHGLNRVPGFGAAKIGIEGLIGQTIAGEKLSSVQRKLYGLAGAFSSISYGLLAISAYTGDLRLASPAPLCSLIASAATAGAQAHIAGQTNAGKIFKDKLLQYFQNIKQGIYREKISDKNLVKKIEKTENIIQNITDNDANDIVKTITDNTEDKEKEDKDKDDKQR